MDQQLADACAADGLWKTVIVGNHPHGEGDHKDTDDAQDVVHLVDVVPDEEFYVFPKFM